MKHSYSPAATFEVDADDDDEDSGSDSPSHPQFGADTAELPLAQKFTKLFGNICFSFFVVSVLVITVVAVTYQPPDPWLTSGPAITSSLSAPVLNSTFLHPDDSILQTGEDLVNVSSASTPPQVSPQNATNLPCSEDSDLDPNAAINCSDPRVLSSIKAFNSRAYYRKSILFISYETPVPGSAPGECDVAWRFRNRREKSWRRYRDYRRFKLANGDNCTVDVVDVGKFRSGINAARPKSRRSSPSRTFSPQIADAEINDTIPVIGSESEFRKGKYLYYTRGGDYCKSMNQYLWSFLCGLGEAQFLNRTFVVDLNVCLSGAYNLASGKDEEGKDFRFYYDFEHLKESASVVEEGEFLRDWRRWDQGGGKKGKISVKKVPTYKVTPMQLRKDKSTILWRQFDGPEPENYWYRVCEGPAANYVQRPWQAIWKSKRLMNIVTEIAGKMDWNYDAVHVVRGWKAWNKELWPNLDADTSPDALLEKLTRELQPMRNLYIATNEPYYNYFDKLRSHFKVHLLDDYMEMWGNTSEWYNETITLNGGKPVSFDGYMRVAVDTEVLFRAKTQVETFYNLTRDCKDGINTC